MIKDKKKKKNLREQKLEDELAEIEKEIEELEKELEGKATEVQYQNTDVKEGREAKRKKKRASKEKRKLLKMKMKVMVLNCPSTPERERPGQIGVVGLQPSGPSGTTINPSYLQPNGEQKKFIPYHRNTGNCQ